MNRFWVPANGFSVNGLILLVAGFLTVFGNAAFATQVLKAYPVGADTLAPLLSLIVVFGGATVLLFAALCIGRATKPVLIVFLLLSSLAAYFMDSYGIVVSDEMLQNVVHTNIAEAGDLMSFKLLAYVVALGVVPALVVARSPLRWQGWRRETAARLKLLGITLAAMAGLVLAFGGFYASFIREHKALRGYANPTYYAYSAVRYAGRFLTPKANTALAAIGLDARIPEWDKHRELIILVVGETARADRFSLNGYARETNPLLSKLDVISFTNFWACGTSTEASLPCMFSVDGDAGGRTRAGTKENLLDVLRHGGVNVLWRDNNSGSKGVGDRVAYQDFRSPDVNPVCDTECRDEGMLHGLQAYIDAHPEGDILIVLHQMGNHGPAYYKRYPTSFEKFTPVCRSNELSQCSREEIGNAYDNAILYTDYFLAKAIELLERNGTRFEAALFYVSDHGESLGENGIYLHGLPKMIAPEAQLRVPAIMWFSKSFDDADIPNLKSRRDTRYEHASIFHTVLGFLEIETGIYQAGLDILNDARPQQERLARETPAR